MEEIIFFYGCMNRFLQFHNTSRDSNMLTLLAAEDPDVASQLERHQTALSEAPGAANLAADQQHLECAQKSESVHPCIHPASNLQVTHIPQHHHLNK